MVTKNYLNLEKLHRYVKIVSIDTIEWSYVL